MSENAPASRSPHPFLRRLTRKNVLAGLMFIAIAAIGLWLSREYPIGTSVRMGTGYMPRLLCWILMALGAVVLAQGLAEQDGTRGDTDAEPNDARSLVQTLGPILFVAASLAAFGLAIESLGLIAAVLLLVAIASFAYPGLGWWETIATAVALAVLCWVVFILGLGLPLRVWPELQSWSW